MPDFSRQSVKVREPRHPARRSATIRTARHRLSQSRECGELARYSTSAMEDTLARCQALVLEFQAAMRVLALPQPAPGRAGSAAATGLAGSGENHGS